MDKKFMLLFVAMFFVFVMMANVSALEFDNVKTYDTETRTATLKNFFGLGKTYAEVQLLSPLDVEVSAGYRKVAEFKATGINNYNQFFQEIDLYDKKKDMKKFERNIDLKFKTNETVEVLDYGTDCNVFNSTLNDYQCQDVVVGSHYEQKEVWKELTNKDIHENDVLIIGLFTNVKLGDSVEWIPKFAGVKVDEWASWKSYLDTNLVSWYDLDGNGDDYFGLENLTAVGTPTNTSGLIKYAYAFDSLTNDKMQNASARANLLAGVTSPFTFNLWFKGDLVGVADQYAFFYGDDYSNVQIYSTGGNIRFRTYGTGSDNMDVSQTTNGNWNMLTLVYNGTHKLAYVNGTFKKKQFTGDLNLPKNKGISIGNYFTGNYGTGVDIDLVGVWNTDLNASAINVLYNAGVGTNPSDVAPSDNPPSVTLHHPTEDQNFSTHSITFNCTVEDDQNLINASLYINNIINQTNSSGFNATYTFNVPLADGDYNWTCDGWDNSSQQTKPSARNFTIDTTSPIVNSANNLTNLTVFSIPTNSTWNYTAYDLHIDKCYYNTSEDATLQFVTCNVSAINTTWTTQGKKTVRYCANDTFGFETCNTDNLWIFVVNYNQSDNPDPVVEGFDATFNLTINMTSIPSTSAYLVLNNTLFWPDTTDTSGGNYYFEKTVNIPDTWGNKTGRFVDWYWNYTITGVTTNRSTSAENIKVYNLAIDDCSTYKELILNMSLKDEELNSLVNGTLGANVEIDLAITSLSNSSVRLVFNNTWTNDNNPQVCLPLNVLNSTQFDFDFTIGFDSTDHVWEFFYLDNGVLNATKKYDAQTDWQINLMDLLTTDSTSFLFNYFDQDGLAVQNTIVHVFRKYIGEGTFREVERSKADQNGDTIVHLVEEDVIYYFLISQYGIPLYTSSNYNALCQSTPCEIQIEASGGFVEFPTDYDLIDGGVVAINSSASTRKVSLTYQLNSTADMNFTVYKYNSDGSYSPVATDLDTGTSGVITLSVPMSAGNVSFFASIQKDDEFITSKWIDFEEKATDRFGVTLSLFIGALIILTLGLVAVTEGTGTIVMVVLGVFLSGALGLFATKLNTGINIVVYLILAGGLILWKITSGRRG